MKQNKEAKNQKKSENIRQPIRVPVHDNLENSGRVRKHDAGNVLVVAEHAQELVGLVGRKVGMLGALGRQEPIFGGAFAGGDDSIGLKVPGRLAMQEHLQRRKLGPSPSTSAECRVSTKRPAKQLVFLDDVGQDATPDIAVIWPHGLHARVV